MTDTWHELEESFRRAIELDGEAREAWLAERARLDPGLARRLRELLAADRADDGQLRAPIAAAVEMLARETEDPWIGRRIGPWHVVRRLAAGGMGAVFLAERADAQYVQRVALKIMSAQLLGPQAVTRFRAERQILASLNHPYIARLIDGGSTDEGLPYIAMEYVEGEPIDAYCERHGLQINQRLELFRRVCEAVNYAHRNLIVHRDLKPGNILVEEGGVPRLLDFGIAKLLDATPSMAGGGITRAGVHAMTPEYASPEQVRGEPVSVATDVYALGVLLFRLLTGESPYGPAAPTSPVDYARAILESPARRPSAAVAPPGRGLAGDLDNIVLRSLQKEPERRYPTVNAFAADIGRYLRQEPVEARGDAWSYRARLFVVRNRREVALGAAVVATLAAVVGIYTARLTDERDRAELAAAQAREVSGFLVDLFRSASPWNTLGRPVSVYDLLDRGRERIGRLDADPLRAELSRIMGSSYSALDAHERALPLLEEAVRLRESTPEEPLALADAWKDLAEAQLRTGDFAAAEAGMRRAIALREGALGRESAPVAEALGRLGNVLYLWRHTPEALEALSEALAIKQRLGEQYATTVDILGNIGITLDALGRIEEAERMIREAAMLSREVEGPRSPDTLTRENNLGLVLLRLGRFEEAVQVHADVLERAREVFPAPHTQQAIIAGSLAGVLRHLGRFAEAEPLFEEACEIVRAAVGENTPAYLARLWLLGLVQIDMARHAQAEATLERALALANSLEGEDGANGGVVRYLLGRLYIDQGRHAEAERMLRRAAPGAARYSAEADVNVRQFLAESLSHQGRHAEALSMIGAVLDEQTAASGADSAPMVWRLVSAAGIHRRSGDVSEALRLAKRAHAVARVAMPSGNWRAALAAAELADALLASGRRAEAVPLYAAARTDLERTFGADDPRVRRLVTAMTPP